MPLEIRICFQSVVEFRRIEIILMDAEQVSRNKLYIYAQDERINLDYRFCMKRVGEAWKIDAVQMRTDGWRRCGL